MHTAPVTKISTHWCYLMEIDFAIRHLQSKSEDAVSLKMPWTEDAVWRNRFPLNNINACWFLLLVQCAQTVLNIQTMYGLDSDYLNCFSNLRQDNGKSLMKTLRLHVIMVEPSHYMFNHNKYVSRMNAIAAKQCLWPHCVTKMTETGSLLSQSLRFKACKTYTTAN